VTNNGSSNPEKYEKNIIRVGERVAQLYLSFGGCFGDTMNWI
jgi:hypothetical protein